MVVASGHRAEPVVVVVAVLAQQRSVLHPLPNPHPQCVYILNTDCRPVTHTVLRSLLVGGVWIALDPDGSRSVQQEVHVHVTCKNNVRS